MITTTIQRLAVYGQNEEQGYPQEYLGYMFFYAGTWVFKPALVNGKNFFPELTAKRKDVLIKKIDNYYY